MIWRYLVLILLATAAAVAQVPNHKYQYNETKNLLPNPGCESGYVKWTETGSGTLSTNSTAANVGSGKAACSWDASAGSEALNTASVTIPAGLYSQNCLARFIYKGGDSNLTATVTDGTDVLNSTTLSARTTYGEVNLPIVCPSSGTLDIEITSSADAAIVYVDDAYIGRNYSVIQAIDAATEWTDYTPTGSMSTNTTYTGKYRRVGDTMEVMARVAWAGAPNAVQLSVDIPSGFTIDTSKINVSSSSQELGNAMLIDNGTGQLIGHVYYIDTNTVRPVILEDASGSNHYTVAVTEIIPFTIASGDSLSMEFSVPIVEWAQTEATALVFSGESWLVDVNIGGADPDLGTNNQTSYVSISDSGLDMVVNEASGLNPQIPCDGGNAPTGLTCSTGNEQVGISWNQPRAGKTEVCFSFSHDINVSGGSGRIYATFQSGSTSTTSDTIVLSGNSRIQGGTNSQGEPTQIPHRICDIYDFTSNGQKVVRLFYEQQAISTINTNTILADRGASNGQRDINITVRPVDQATPMPLVINSVNTNYSGIMRLGTANITNNGSTAGVGTQYGTWVDSAVRQGAGDVDFTITTGFYSSAPHCYCNNLSTARFCKVACSSATSCTLSEFDHAGNSTDSGSTVLCFGPQ